MIVFVDSPLCHDFVVLDKVVLNSLFTFMKSAERKADLELFWNA